MKKLYLLLFAGIFLLCMSTSAIGYHIEYGTVNKSGTFELWTADPDQFYFDAFDGGGVYDFWEVSEAVEQQDGTVEVTYNESYEPGFYMSQSSIGFSFQIVSDYGNTDQILIDAHAWGDANTAAYLDFLGSDKDVPVNGHVNNWGSLWNDYGSFKLDINAIADYPPDTYVQSWNGDDEFFQIYTNTVYNVMAELNIELVADIFGWPSRTTFADWDDYNDYFSEGDFGDLYVDSCENALSYGLSIDTTETPNTVPEPATMLLFGLGLLGLTGLNRKK